MLDTISKLGTKKTMAAVIFTVSVIGNWGAASAFTGETCAFVKQLEDPAESSNFQMQVSAAMRASRSQYGEFQADTPLTLERGGVTYQVDSFSFNCMACHDGATSPAHDISFKSAANSGTYSGNALGSHPIGTHYGSAAYVNNQLRRLEYLDQNMILIDGKVGCLTCHNPLNRTAPHLTVSMDGSNLCLNCHIK
jgi:predicted CXXCH cytochrome family protein